MPVADGRTDGTKFIGPLSALPGVQKSLDSCFLNNYNPVLLKTWQVNLDLQPLYDYYNT